MAKASVRKVAVQDAEDVDSAFKVVTTAATAVKVDELATEIDALGAMTEDVAKAAKLLKNYSERKEAVKAKMVDLGIPQKVGVYYYADLGEPADSRFIKDKNALVEALGVKTFLELASVTMGDIDKYTNEAQQATFIGHQDGARRFSIKKRV